jgi:RNA polymerase sigma factor (sigma-70 family)
VEGIGVENSSSSLACIDDVEAGEVFEIARRFLGRWEDAYTKSHREELSNETVVCALQGRGSVRDRERFPAFVRTIARRKRADGMREHHARLVLSLDTTVELRDQLTVPAGEEDLYPVGGTWVEKAALLAELPAALSRLTELNQRILRGFYAGSTCAELAQRFGLPRHCIKVRLHRSRRAVREILTRHVDKETGDVRNTCSATWLGMTTITEKNR